jgi:hypothetical protein
MAMLTLMSWKSMKLRRTTLFLLCPLWVVATSSLAAVDWDAGRDFKANEVPNGPQELLNPNGTVPAWSYGHRALFATSGLTLYVASEHVNEAGNPAGLDGWSSGSSCVVNRGDTQLIYDFGAGPNLPLEPGEMAMHPSSNNEFAVVRWTAPASGTYSLLAWWRDLDAHGGNGGSAGIVTNGVMVFEEVMANGGATGFTNSLALLAGDTVDFLLGSSGDWGYDTTAFNVVITEGNPTLSIVPAGPGQVKVSWFPDPPGWFLQERADLNAGNWQNAPSGSANPATIPAEQPITYYRLIKPPDLPPPIVTGAGSR